MNGYLMQELAFHAGDHAFVESYAAEGRFGVVFEDDGETGYFYAVAKDLEGEGFVILDALHIYEASEDDDGDGIDDAEGDDGDIDDDADDDADDGAADDEGSDERIDRGEGAGDDGSADEEADGDEDGDIDDESEEGVAADEDDSSDPGDDGSGPADGDEEGDGRASTMQIVWSKDWLKCALVIDGYCQAVFDFEAKEGYNINEFPPANQIWSKGERTLTDEIVQKLF